VRGLLAGTLGVVAALLVSCSGGGGGLIAASNAGPLKGDFEEVLRAAENGNGNCSETETALAKTELDFRALPTSVNGELRKTLEQGIDNYKLRALALCTQPLPVTTTAPATTTTPTTTPTTTTTPGSGGGTASEEPKHSEEAPGKGKAGEEPPGKSKEAGEEPPGKGKDGGEEAPGGKGGEVGK
jgi:hypothetical protein